MQKDAASIILMGHQLEAKAAQQLESKLASEPDEYEDRLSLIGYYYKHYYCCEIAGRRRIDHIVWLVRKHPDFKPILHSYLYAHLLDRRAYACIKAAWQAALGRAPNNIEILCNMANFVQNQEPELALELYERALGFAPGNSSVHARLEKLKGSMDTLMENRDSVLKSGDSYFVPGAVVCPDAKLSTMQRS
jgi:tetratricopeptide (TPR) repeat protein